MKLNTYICDECEEEFESTEVLDPASEDIICEACLADEDEEDEDDDDDSEVELDDDDDDDSESDDDEEECE